MDANDQIIASFMEITHCDRDIALVVLPKYKYDLDNALSHFFDGSWLEEGSSSTNNGGGDPQIDVKASRANLAIPNTTSMQMDSVVHNDVEITGEDGDTTVSVFLPYKGERDKGGAQNPIVCHLSQNHILGVLKQFVSKETKIPGVVLRCVFQGQSFTDNNVTLKSMGLTTRGGNNDVLFLHPPRDENGTVTVQDKSKYVVMTLSSGEWNVSTSITELRNVIATEHDWDPSSVVLVFNGLTLADHTSFGLNGISAGSVITMLSEDAGTTMGGGKKGRKGGKK